MEFFPSELIRKKRFGGEHSREEIRYLIQGYSKDQIPDYQMAAWLMAICFQGMTPNEAAVLTQEMRDSGVVLDLTSLGTTVDKHSTGGMGDKTSLILAPLAAAAGVPVPMMAGRGLAHTGGTLDKLESISGFNVRLDFESFKSQIQEVGAAIIGQTHEMCPADRKLYALRDVTGTVDSMPLICGSIMSKKLAEGMSALVLDVKYGSGAFMKKLDDAEALAKALMDIGKRSDKKVVSLLTRMDEPLGRYVGNALEVRECLDILEGKTGPGGGAGDGKSYADTIELTLELAAHMIHLGGKAKSHAEGREKAQKLIKDGSALSRFHKICEKQGGSLSKGLPEARMTEVIRAEFDGFMKYSNLEKLGLASVHLGAGRKFQTDQLDLAAGIEVFCEQGQRVKAGDTLFKVYFSENSKLQAALPVLRESFTLADKATPRSPLIAKVLT